MNTRYADLARLEEARDLGNKKAGRMLERMNREVKNSNLERLRRELIEAHRRGDVSKTLQIEEALRKMR